MRKNEGLTAKQVEHMPANPERRIEAPAGPPKGLYLVIHPSGKKGWCLRYRYHGRTRNLTLTPGYPEMSLAAARAEAVAALKDLDAGRDPAAVHEAEEQAEAMRLESIGVVAEEFLKRKVRPSEKRWKETERILLRETQSWRNRPISDVKKPDVLRLLDAIVDRNAPVMSCRTRGVLMRFFTWAVGRGYIEHSPMVGVGKPGPDNQHRDRVLSDSELAEVWMAAETLGYPYGSHIQFLLLTAQRRGEVASLRWRDLRLDHPEPAWILPGQMAKPGRLNDIPLSRAAVAILESLPRPARAEGDFVFSFTNGKTPMTNFGDEKTNLDAAIAKLREQAGREKADEKDRWTVHDLRRTCATLLASLGVQPHVISAILNHSTGPVFGITAVYNRFQYASARREALEKLADYLGQLHRSAARIQTA